VDYTNAFSQAEMQEELYVDPPKLFAPGKGRDLVLKLLKFLYGLKQAPKTFYEKLRDGLLQRGFKQSIHDPCLFMKHELMCFIYGDDTIIAGPDAARIQDEIKVLGFSQYKEQQKFELRDEGEVDDFLGIRITKQAAGAFLLTQTGLIYKVLVADGLQDCNLCTTPAATTPVGAETAGDPFSKSWEYASIFGMLMYLAANTRPDIAYAVHQAALHTPVHRESHARAIKRVIPYLKGKKDKGIFFKPDETEKVDCYVDSDFAGLFNVEYGQAPI
jgi:hypothetical protein